MKIRSKNLLLYLQQQDVLDKSPEEIEAAKVLYRKLYKRAWKHKHSGKKKEIRPTFSGPEYAALKKRADLFGTTPTGYAKGVILDHIGAETFIPHRDTLLEVLQCISRAVTSEELETAQLIIRAEHLLLGYLRNH